ncbi:SusC/RagA family TonB-linked outer membrane protein [Pleomorphovibrio marinus]|uniref:SusC/RagA family TonB-linked outer membrane protein n=1 Tax=Pleomorphovibrio marinus TaxID=2164132 RepID=UPI001E550888|nr:SusC/RagA family TonB-linked outer membrane protein [Pleomorphovibrio marinus]
MGVTYTFIGFVFQLLFINMLWATETHAQRVKSIQDVVIQVEIQDKTLIETFRVLERKSPFTFVYDKKDAFLSQKFNLERQTLSVEDILVAIARENKLKFKQVNNNITVSKPVTYTDEVIEVVDTNIEITGTVTDENGEPMPGVTVIIEGTNLGTVTDIDGRYSLEAEEGAVLRISFIGYTAQRVTVSNLSTINVVLKEDQSSLDEVVVIGYGTQQRSDITGSIATLKTEDVVTVPVTNVKNLFAGRVPGVLSMQTPGLPGNDNADLRIRGFGNALVIVDGVESFLDRIDPNDIESISVLKDASAAIYGARAGNGVILITTKKGKEGAVQLNVHSYAGVQNPTLFPRHADAAGYIQMARAGHLNGQYDPNNPGQDINYGEFTEERLYQYQSGELQSHDWISALLRDGGGRINSNNINASGGNENVRFYSSVGYLTQNGLFDGDYDYRKINITNNLDAKIGKRINLSLMTSYIEEERDYAEFDPATIWRNLQTAEPFFPTELPDPSRVPYSGFTERNPVGGTRKDFSGFNYTKLETIAAALQLDYDVPNIEGLNMGFRFNVRMRNIYNETLAKPFEVFEYNPINEEYILRGNRSVNQFSKRIGGNENDPNRRVLSRFFMDYQRQFEKHKVGGLVFYEMEDNVINITSALRRNLLSPSIPQLSAGDDALTTTGGTGVMVGYGRSSYAGRLNYEFDNRFLLEGTFRADGSSKFDPEVRWGFFPSVSAGWKIHNEEFLRNSNTVDEMKIRLSYTQTGIDANVGNTAFQYLSGFSELAQVYYLDRANPTTQIRTTGLANPFITWEETTMYNAGMDFGLFQGKLYGNVDVFYRYRDGLLRQPLEGLPSTFGANLPLFNLDSRSDRGFEFLVGYQTNIGKVKLDVSGNFTYARQRYEKFQENIDFDDPNQVRIDRNSNQWVNRWFGYRTDGIFNSQEEVETWIANHDVVTINGTPRVGDIRYLDVSGPDGVPDGVIDRFDLQQIGYSGFPEINFGLNLNLNYNNFALTTVWQGASRFNINVTGMYRSPFDNEIVPMAIHTKYSWTQDPNNPGVGNNPNAQLPAFDYDGRRPWNDVNSDFWLKDGTYLRLRTAQLSYNVPQVVAQKVWTRSIRFYVAGENLMTFSRLGIFNGILDPEQSSNVGGFGLPLLRSYTLGIMLGI